MTKFNATQFTKHGFVHLKDEDFNDDGTKFQIWMHEESGLKVSYARYNYVNENGKKETEYFISPREGYYEHGLLYSDVSGEPEFNESEKFNGCYEVDVDELVELLIARHEMMLRVKAAVDNEEIDMTAVYARAEEEMEELNSLVEQVKNIRWWDFKGYKLDRMAQNVKSIERDIEKLRKVLNGEIDRREQRQLVNRVEEYNYVADRLADGSKYSSYNELVKLAR